MSKNWNVSVLVQYARKKMGCIERENVVYTSLDNQILEVKEVEGLKNRYDFRALGYAWEVSPLQLLKNDLIEKFKGVNSLEFREIPLNKSQKELNENDKMDYMEECIRKGYDVSYESLLTSIINKMGYSEFKRIINDVWNDDGFKEIYEDEYNEQLEAIKSKSQK